MLSAGAYQHLGLKQPANLTAQLGLLEPLTDDN
jgi:hypothetical protein